MTGAIICPRNDGAIDGVAARAYSIPTDRPESDGTYSWNATTLIVVHVYAGGMCGFGYSYGSAAAVELIEHQLAACVREQSALATERCFDAMLAEVRNVGRAGIAACAISALDTALWDLKAKLLDLPLVSLLGDARERVEVYGSGGFISYDIGKLCEQLVNWADQGMRRVKMKVGRDPRSDVARVRAARLAVGPDVELMVDANGGYDRARARGQAQEFARSGVTWFEEPVSSDDLEGLRLLRDCAPEGMCVAAGEYGYDLQYFRRMLAADAVDVLQADATRCLGVTGFLAAARLCQAFCMPLSAHTAPSLHAHLGCAVTPLIHVEYFHDHARIEHMLFDGCLEPERGALRPDRSRPGLGVELKTQDAERFAVGSRP